MASYAVAAAEVQCRVPQDFTATKDRRRTVTQNSAAAQRRTGMRGIVGYSAIGNLRPLTMADYHAAHFAFRDGNPGNGTPRAQSQERAADYSRIGSAPRDADMVDEVEDAFSVGAALNDDLSLHDTCVLTDAMRRAHVRAVLSSSNAWRTGVKRQPEAAQRCRYGREGIGLLSAPRALGNHVNVNYVVRRPPAESGIAVDVSDPGPDVRTFHA
ncbi:MAG: hypothetical protein GYA73_13985 [Planctomycetes bacterium]|nr:hypothetical protein [Planctomycetota bacterium]